MGSTSGDDAGLTRDGFLGGKVMLWQPARGYRAGADPVLLAASVTAKAGERVLDLGCGAGAAVLCLGARVGGLELHGLELQPDYAALGRRNAAANGVALELHEGDVRRMPAALRALRFDHVMMNPPYHDRARGTGSVDAGRDLALGGEAPVGSWVDAAVRRLRPGGRLWMVQRVARLPEVLAAIDSRLGAVTVLPLAAREGRGAELFLLRAKKGDKSLFRLLYPLFLHAGGTHLRDAPDFRPEIAAVLREGAALDWRD
jgi:tRNA1Val (adenine37-N6)-methyltransferase